MNDFYLIEIDGFDPVKSGTNTLYLSTGKGFTTPPTGTPANTYYTPLVINPGRYHRDLFSTGTTGGNSSTMYGDMEFANPDGTLDYLLTWGLDGHPVRIKTSAGATIFTGISEQLTGGWKTFSLRIRDSNTNLQVPFKTHLYGGTNTNGAGVDGEVGLLNTFKPFIMGGCALMPPVLVNTSKLIYQMHDASVIAGFAVTSLQVYDMGLPLTSGAYYISQADMEANAPAPGTFRHWPYGGMVRLGSTPAGKVSATVDNPQPMHILLGFALAPLGSPYTSSIPTSAPFDASGIGILVGDTENIDSVLDRLCAPLQLWWAFDKTGTFRAGSMDPQYWGAPVVTLDNSNIISAEILQTNDANCGVPIRSLDFQWNKNFAVHNATEVAGSVTYANNPAVPAQFFTQQYAEVPTTYGVYPLAKHLLADTKQLFQCERITDNNLEAVFLAIEHVQAYEHMRLELKVREESVADLAAVLDLGVICQVKITNSAGQPRLGLGANGRSMIVLGIEPDLGSNSLTVDVWG
jgi:hypothetical protein